MSDVVCGIMTSRRAGARRRWIRRTWGRHFDHLFYSDHWAPWENVVHVSRATHYKSNEEKHINFLNLFGPRLAARYRWIFCCDDDTFVLPQNLSAFLAADPDPSRVHGSVDSLEKCPGNPIFNRVDPSLHYPAGGCGYLVSREVIKKIHPLKNFGTGYSDVSFGLNLAAHGVGLDDRDDLFFAQTPEHFGCGPSGDPHAISYHYIKTASAVECLAAGIPPSPARKPFRLPLSWWPSVAW